jgi:hypothetical protein
LKLDALTTFLLLQYQQVIRLKPLMVHGVPLVTLACGRVSDAVQTTSSPELGQLALQLAGALLCAAANKVSL